MRGVRRGSRPGTATFTVAVVFAAVLVALTLSGCGAIASGGFAHQADPAAQPSIVVPAGPVPAAPPTRLTIPVIGLDRDVSTLPASSCPRIDPPTLDDPYWLECRGAPGTDSRDTVIVAGHAVAGGHGVFNSLHRLRPGDQIVLGTPNGRLEYIVTQVVTRERSAVAGERSLQKSIPGRLMLVTCSVVDDQITSDNLFVMADLVH